MTCKHCKHCQTNERKLELERLLGFCHHTQKIIFNKMYPNYPNNSQLKHAIFQCKNTIDKNIKKGMYER